MAAVLLHRYDTRSDYSKAARPQSPLPFVSMLLATLVFRMTTRRRPTSSWLSLVSGVTGTTCRVPTPSARDLQEDSGVLPAWGFLLAPLTMALAKLQTRKCAPKLRRLGAGNPRGLFRSFQASVQGFKAHSRGSQHGAPLVVVVAS
ncbi:unnamed protein product [Symbiodinium sp. CCMP2456]|nr:unnamed protein product [Symbiodinium sp. CCMP2456]